MRNTDLGDGLGVVGNEREVIIDLRAVIVPSPFQKLLAIPLNHRLFTVFEVWQLFEVVSDGVKGIKAPVIAAAQKITEAVQGLRTVTGSVELGSVGNDRGA